MPCWKSARRRSGALSLVLLLLAACSQPAEPPKPAEPPPAAPAPAPAASAWSADGKALVLREGGAEVVRMECANGSLTVHGERFHHVDSEERMSVGAGDVVVTLVATADGQAVKGEGQADPDFLRAFSEGRKFAINYGYQNLGPYDGPPPALAATFAKSCAP